MKNTELKPCPFCGSECDIIVLCKQTKDFDQERNIKCRGCNFSMNVIGDGWKIEDLIDVWNNGSKIFELTSDAVINQDVLWIEAKHNLPSGANVYINTKQDDE